MYAFTSIALLLSSALANPTPFNHLFIRDPDNTNNLPDANKVCNGNTYSPDEIKTAVSFGWQAMKDGKQYSESIIEWSNDTALYDLLYLFSPV